MNGFNFTIKNRTLLGFVQTEVQDGKACGAIVVEHAPGECVTAWYRSGDASWSHGNYHASYPEAFADFLQRATGWLRPLPSPTK